jgi:hypothetical protein
MIEWTPLPWYLLGMATLAVLQYGKTQYRKNHRGGEIIEVRKLKKD